MENQEIPRKIKPNKLAADGDGSRAPAVRAGEDCEVRKGSPPPPPESLVALSIRTADAQIAQVTRETKPSGVTVHLHVAVL